MKNSPDCYVCDEGYVRISQRNEPKRFNRSKADFMWLYTKAGSLTLDPNFRSAPNSASRKPWEQHYFQATNAEDEKIGTTPHCLRPLGPSGIGKSESFPAGRKPRHLGMASLCRCYPVVVRLGHALLSTRYEK